MQNRLYCSLCTYLVGVTLLFFTGYFTAPLKASAGGIKFIENQGQWEDNVLYRADIPNGYLFVEHSTLSFVLYDPHDLHDIHDAPTVPSTINGHVLKMHFDKDNAGKQKAATHTANNKAHAHYNFFLGNDPENWASGVPAYEQVELKNVRPGMHLELLSNGSGLKYNIHLDEGADHEGLEVVYEGADALIAEGNQLTIETSVFPLTEYMPLVYQKGPEGDKHNLDGKFKVEGNRVSFDISGNVMAKQPMVIDPELIFSTYSGSEANNFGYTATYDDLGHGYSGGSVFGAGFPSTAGAFQENYAGGSPEPVGGGSRDIGILKYSPDGRVLEYATYLGGKNNNEDAHSLVVNSNNQLVIFGTTNADDFPVTSGTYDTEFNGHTDMFLAILSEDGSNLLASTFIGGSGLDGRNGEKVEPEDEGMRIPSSPLHYNYGDIFRGEVIVDNNDNILVASTTSSSDFPVTTGALQEEYPGGLLSGVLLEMSPELTSMNWGTFTGGTGSDAMLGLRKSDEGIVYATGGTTSPDFPMPSESYNMEFSGTDSIPDAVVIGISNAGTTLHGATYLGTDSYDQAFFLDIDPTGDIWVTGQTEGNFPTSHNTEDIFHVSGAGQFLTRLDPGLTFLVNSTLFGIEDENPVLSPSAFMVDNCGRIYFSGWGGDLLHNPYSHGPDVRSLPVTSNAFQTASDINNSAFYLTMFSNDLTEHLFGSFFGGKISHEHVDGGTSRFDPDGVIYQSVCAGCHGNSDFPATTGAHSEENKSSGCNNALFKMDINPLPIVADFEIPDQICVLDTFKIENHSERALNFYWDFGNGDTSMVEEPEMFYALGGEYDIQLIVTNHSSCKVSDTIEKTITVYEIAEASFYDDQMHCTDSITFVNTSSNSREYFWDFGNGDTSNEESPVMHWDADRSSEVKLIVDQGTACVDSTSAVVELEESFSRVSRNVVHDACLNSIEYEFTGHMNEGIEWHLDDTVYKDVVFEHNFQEAGIYPITLYIDTEGPCPDTMHWKDTIQSTPHSAFDYNVEPCVGKVQFEYTGENADSLVWIMDDNNTYHKSAFEHGFKDTGYHEVMLIAIAGNCADTSSNTIHIREILSLGFDYEVLECNNYYAFENRSEGAVSYEWYIEDEFVDSTEDIDYYRFDEPGEKKIELLGKTGLNCEMSISSVIEVDTFPQANFIYTIGECPGDFSFEKEASANTHEQNWYIDNQLVSTDPAFEYYFENEGLYTVRFITEPDSVCSDTAVKQVSVNDNPNSDFDYTVEDCEGEVSFVNQSLHADDFYWEWKSGSSEEQHPQMTLPGGGSYEVMLVSKPNTLCADTLYREVSWEGNKPDMVEIPNVFSPNDDGINEVLEVKGIDDNCRAYEWIIYNRWGEKVYHREEGPFAWDGTSGDAPNEAGTYYYIFKGPGWEKQGTISLFR